MHILSYQFYTDKKFFLCKIVIELDLYLVLKNFIYKFICEKFELEKGTLKI